MVITYAELSQYLAAYWLPFARISGFFILALIFGDGYVPVRVRVLLSVLVTVVIVPSLPLQAPRELFDLMMFKDTILELIFGLFLGWLFQVFIGIFSTIGQTISMQMGMAMATMNDPTNGITIAIVGNIFHIAAILLFLSLDGHIAILIALHKSFETWPLAAGISVMQINTIVAMAGWMMVTAFGIAIPAIATMLISNATFGFMSKAAPSLNIFALGFPMTMLLGLFALTLSITNMGAYYNELLLQALDFAKEFINGGRP